MTNNSSGNTAAVTSSNTGKLRLLNQWGGKLAFFFSYLHLSHDIMTGLLPALLPFIRQDLDLSYLQSGLLVTAFSLTAGLSQLLGGWLSDRISKTKAISIGLGGVGLAAIAIIFTPSYHILLVVLIALGLFAGFYHPSAVSALSTQFEAQRRGRVLSLHMLGGTIGFGLGPLLGAIIATKFSWHLAYVLLGLPALVASVLVFTRLKLTPKILLETKVAPQEKVKTFKGVWGVFKPAIGIIAISIAMQLVTGPVMSFVSLFLIDVHHLSAAAGSMWVTIIRVGGLLGNLVGGWLIDKWGRRNTIYLILAMFGPVVLLVAKLPYGFGLGAAFILFGWLMAMRETTIQTLLMDQSPPQLRATIIGIYFSFGQQGSSIIQPIAGNFMDAIGISGVFNSIAFISIGLSAMVIVLIFRNTRKLKNPAQIR